MDKKEGCSCFNPALVEHAMKQKKSSLHTATCPVCHKTCSTNRQGAEVVCLDCSKVPKHKVEVLGIGGKQYNDTLRLVTRAVMGTKYRAIPVTDLETIMTYGVAVTPAVVIDDEVVCEGNVPDYGKICEWVGKRKSIE